MRAAQATVGLLAAGALCGCGASDRDQVKSKVEQFVTATAHKDYNTICGQVLAPALLARLAASGIPCQQAMQIGLGGVQKPTLSIGSITVSGQTASVITLTTAAGQRASLDAIQLVKTRGGWRITSLGSPATPGQASPGKSK